MSLCGLTHKQAVQCLKGPGQVSTSFLGAFPYFQSFPAVAPGRSEAAEKQNRTFLVSFSSFLTLHLNTIFFSFENVKARRWQTDVLK